MAMEKWEREAGVTSSALRDSSPRRFNLGLIIILTKPFKNTPKEQGRGKINL